MIGRLRGTARATGRRIDVDLVHLWTVGNGKATRCAAFVDTPAVQAALVGSASGMGLVP